MRSLGHVEAIFRYPVKSMAGERLDEAELGFHGVEGDRRYAFRRLDDPGGKPWLTGSKLPQMVCMQPHSISDAEISALHGAPVQRVRFDHGMFDEGDVSVIARSTIDAIGPDLDVRRFRPNILMRTDAGIAFEEDAWVGAILVIGEVEIAVTEKDERCVMVNFDPDTAASDPSILKSIVRLHGNYAGVYGSVIRRGRVAVGARVELLDRRS